MQERARATRRALLESAAYLFLEQGYAGTSVTDISVHSGKTSGAIYFHYSSKENLALAVVREQFASWPQLVTPYAAPGVPPLEKLVALSFSVAQALSEDTVARAGARLWTERRSIDAAVPTPFDAWVPAVTRLLAEARIRDELADGIQPSETAATLVCAFFGVCALGDDVPGGRHWSDRLERWWSLVLCALQAHPDPDTLIAQAQMRTPARQEATTQLVRERE
ncbi:ScbR family autoregulator-binding transcription factor [Streptomyces sp. NPDC052071]|uniref:ScbR family autoregulator-binding transcription factor n=1 Tax=Streptomyces TaxID=1883 RepID=UPI0032520C14